MLSDQKREVINVLLKALDGFDQSRLFGVCLLGMTNEIKLLDPAFLRPGRFHPQIEVPEPDNPQDQVHVHKVHASST